MVSAGGGIQKKKPCEAEGEKGGRERPQNGGWAGEGGAGAEGGHGQNGAWHPPEGAEGAGG